MKTGVHAMRTGVPCNESRFFPVWKTSHGKPCSGPVLALQRIAVFTGPFYHVPQLTLEKKIINKHLQIYLSASYNQQCQPLDTSIIRHTHKKKPCEALQVFVHAKSKKYLRWSRMCASKTSFPYHANGNEVFLESVFNNTFF